MIESKQVVSYLKAVVALIQTQRKEQAQKTHSQMKIYVAGQPKYLLTEEIWLVYATGIFHTMIKQPIADFRSYLMELKALTQTSSSEEIVALYALGISLLITIDSPDRLENVAELERIANFQVLSRMKNEYRSIPIVQEAYAGALAYTAEKRPPNEMEIIVLEMAELYETYNTELMACSYALVLYRSISLGLPNSLIDIKKLKALTAQYSSNYDITQNYAKAIIAAVSLDRSTCFLQSHLDSMIALYTKFNNSEVIALCYAQLLSYILSSDMADLIHRESLNMLMNRFPDNPMIAHAYVVTSMPSVQYRQDHIARPSPTVSLTLGELFPKPLSSREERECLERIRQGDQTAKNKLIEHNLRLVAHIIKRYYSNMRDQDDLISIGTIGLIKAASTFNYEKGAKFATYASRCIENEILMHYRSLKKTAQDVFISDPIDTDKEGNSLTLQDIMSDDENIFEQIDLRLRAEKMHKFIASSLSEREKDILVMRYGLFGHKPMTQREVAGKMNISRSYVSRIEGKAISILRREFTDKKFL
jgi:RNA polymerase sporulation-specific sigma factor